MNANVHLNFRLKIPKILETYRLLIKQEASDIKRGNLNNYLISLSDHAWYLVDIIRRVFNKAMYWKEIARECKFITF